ncbi:MAG: heparinase II/III family protein [Magnetococcus sp. WYHC-3]
MTNNTMPLRLLTGMLMIVWCSLGEEAGRVTTDAPAHGRPFFMPAQERTRIRELIASNGWAKADYARIQAEGGKGNGYLAAFLYALDGDPAMAQVAEKWLLGQFGEKTYTVSRARSLLADPDFFRLGVPHITDVFYDTNFSPYLAFDWSYAGLTPTAREKIREGLVAFLRYKMRCMDRWTQTPNLVFKPTTIVAFAGLAIQDQQAIEWGLYRKPESEIGGYFPVLNNMLKDGGAWHEAPTYPITHSDLYCMSMMSRYRSLYDGKEWWSACVPNGGSPKGLMDYYLDTAYPIERTGYGPGQIRVVTYADGATYAGGDLFLVNPAGPGIDMAKTLTAAYNTSGDPRLAPFVAMLPNYQPDLLDRRPLPEKFEFPPAPSKVWPDYGLAILRAVESPAYWRSSAPVAFQLMTRTYGHEHNDKFSLIFHGAGRLLYPDYNAIQYENASIGWSHNTMAHNTLMVDEGETQPVPACAIRHDFRPEVKYLATSASGVFAKVAQTRVLLLTREYLLDVFQADSPVPRVYDYLLHSFGAPRPVNPERFQPSTALDRRFWLVSDRQAMTTDGPWALDFVIKEEPGSRKGKFGPEWYDHTAAVRVTMAAEPATLVTRGISGIELGKQVKHTFDPLGMLIVRRAGVRQTVFTAVHEPYTNAATPRITAVTVLARTEHAMLVRVDAADYTDYAAVSFGSQTNAVEHRLAAADGSGIRVAFQDYGYLRVKRDGTMSACGGWKGLRIPATNSKFVLNGKPVRSSRQDGCLAYGSLPAINIAETVAAQECPLSVQITPEVARLEPGGRRAVTFTMANTGKAGVSGNLAFELPAGVITEPATPVFPMLAPGETAQVPVTFLADGKVAEGDVMGLYRVISRMNEAAPVTAAALPVHLAIGPVLRYVYQYPKTNVFHVDAPRYTIRHDMFHGLCRYLADDDGNVRLDGAPLFTFRDDKDNLLWSGTRSAYTWTFRDPVRIKAHTQDVLQYHVGFGADRITVHMDVGWGRFYQTHFTVPGEWISPKGTPAWRRVIAVEANGREVEAGSVTNLPITAAELAFPDGGWSLAFQFMPPQLVRFDGTMLQFSIGNFTGDAWSIGFCRPGELDDWRQAAGPAIARAAADKPAVSPKLGASPFH